MKFNIRRIPHQAGFTLIEIMVGLVIGMLVALVITQVLSIFEGQKRATTGTADAQTNGSIALYNISRELQLAGYPLMPTGSPGVADSPLECTTVKNAATNVDISISPFTIIDGGVGANPASDQIVLQYGNSPSGGVPTQIGAMVGSIATVTSNFGCQANDITLVNNGTNCALSIANAVSANTTPPTTPVTITLANAMFATVGANISCLGSVWNTVTYAVNAGNLERNGVAVVAGVVNLQAQYGISATANSNTVTQWVDASAAPWVAPITAANRNRIKSVRVAVITRNTKIEPFAVTTACSSITTASPTGLCAWDATTANPSVASPAPTVDLSVGNANWNRYHYRVFETVIPTRSGAFIALVRPQLPRSRPSSQKPSSQ